MRAVCMMLARTKSRTIEDATWLPSDYTFF